MPKPEPKPKTNLVRLGPSGTDCGWPHKKSFSPHPTKFLNGTSKKISTGAGAGADASAAAGAVLIFSWAYLLGHAVDLTPETFVQKFLIISSPAVESKSPGGLAFKQHFP